MIKIFSHFNKEEDKILRNISVEVQKEEFNTRELKKKLMKCFNL